jgi:hypothetical protein
LALLMKMGVPPTPLKARTGELTPPGIQDWAWVNKSLLFMLILVINRYIDSACGAE